MATTRVVGYYGSHISLVEPGIVRISPFSPCFVSDRPSLRLWVDPCTTVRELIMGEKRPLQEEIRNEMRDPKPKIGNLSGRKLYFTSRTDVGLLKESKEGRSSSNPQVS